MKLVQGEVSDLVDRLILGEKGSYKDLPAPSDICIAVREPDSGDHILIRAGLILGPEGFSQEILTELAGLQGRDNCTLSPELYEEADRHARRCGKCYSALCDIVGGF